jgi:outer membrane immunogenic protein
VAPTFLLYATGALAVGERRFGAGGFDLGPGPPFNSFNQVSNTSVDWTVGAGAELIFAPHWSVKAEYLYVDPGSVSSAVSIRLYPTLGGSYHS